MLFSSFSFIFIFLPIAWSSARGARFLGGRSAEQAAVCIASLVFYALWDIRFVPILLFSISVNFWIGGRILLSRSQLAEDAARRWLIAGVSFNLIVLGVFKYGYFLVSNLAALFGAPPPFSPLFLPLAISFVTFQKIAYLVDCRRGVVLRHGALNYLFFVLFFPQLIAGPIVHHRQLVVQIDEERNPLRQGYIGPAVGIFFFAVGLLKKVVLADSLARYATPVFELARHAQPSTYDAWQATLAYTLQLYFDFSGYSDMALGLGLLFGFRLPLNFTSPYRSLSLIDFWRRWHITLSAFLRDYLYIPLGGNRSPGLGRYKNILFTMLLAGFWHGAGWNFVVWGIAHGVLLLINHAWRSLIDHVRIFNIAARALPAIFYGGLTFTCVALGWVAFRAHDMSAAGRMYIALCSWSFAPPEWPYPVALLGNFLSVREQAGWLWICLGLGIVWTAPSAAQIVAYDATPNTVWKGRRPDLILGVLAGIALWTAFKWMAVEPPSEFLYFNF
jgi:alginate O-acetyltransferase complex protein AlgI